MSLIAEIALEGSGGNRTVMIRPVANQTGTATITVTVTDLGGLSASEMFFVTVNPRAADPVIRISPAGPAQLPCR